MPRGLTGPEKAECAKRVRSSAYLLDLVLAYATTRIWTGRGSLTSGGVTWIGAGEALSIEGLESAAGLEAQSISITLNGVPTDKLPSGVMEATRAERYQGRVVRCYLALLNPDTGALLFTPKVVWSGYADTLSFSLGSSLSATLTADHYTSHLRRANGLRLTTESHNTRLGNVLPRDLFFEQQGRLLGRASTVI